MQADETSQHAPKNAAPAEDTQAHFDYLKHRKVLIYFLPTAGAFVSITYLFIFEFILQYHLASVMITGSIIGYLAVIYFVSVDRPSLAKHVLTLNFLIEVGVHSLFLFERDASYYLYFLTGIPLIHMLFSDQERHQRLLYSLADILLLIIAVLLLDGSQQQPSISHQQLTLLHMSNVISSIIVLSITILIFVRFMERAEIVFWQQAIHDPLTSLFNRRHFFSLARSTFQQYLREKNIFTLAYIDLDHFKRINDRHGHDAGDIVLREVANILRAKTRAYDIVARIGGEEFVILFPNSTISNTFSRAETLRLAIEDIAIEDYDLQLSASIGVSSVDELDNGISDVLKRADQALYRAKSAGRNIVMTE